MRVLFFITVLLCFSQIGFSQRTDTLFINYYSQAAFAFQENGEVKGLEIDIVNEYLLWLKNQKQLSVAVKYVKFTDFDLFYSKTKAASKNTMGLGSVTTNPERMKEVDFTTAYLKNVSYCITNGNAPDIKSKTPNEIVKVLGAMTAVTLTNSTLNNYLNDIKKVYLPELKIIAQTSETKILDEIARNVLYFGYVDAVSFWFYLKNNPSRFLKMQKFLSQSQEELAFMMPKGSQHKAMFNEFFNGATGFRKNKNYRLILEKYLGTFMTQNMAVN